MSRRNFATVDAVLVLICVAIFAGGVLAQTGQSASTTALAPPVTSTGDKP